MKQHFIPVFLLSAWTDPDSDGTLESFWVGGGEVSSSRRHPEAVGFQHDLVSFTGPLAARANPDLLETDLLTPADTQGARIRQKLIAGKGRSLTPVERGRWVRFLLSLPLRQPQVVRQMRDDWPEHLRAELAKGQDQYAEMVGPDDPETLIEWTEKIYPEVFENHGLTILPELMEDRRTAQKVGELHWWVVDFTKSKHDLLIGDDPCIIDPALDAPELLLGLPLSPRCAFLASRGDKVERILRYRTDATHVARWLNERTVAQARERVFAVDQKPQRFIENRRGGPPAGC